MESPIENDYYQRQASARIPLLRRFFLLTAFLTLIFCGWDRVVDEWAWLSNLAYRGLGSLTLALVSWRLPPRLSALNFDRLVVGFALLYSLYLIFLLGHLNQGLTLGMPCLSVFLTLCCFLVVHSRHSLGLVVVLAAVSWASWRCGLHQLVLYSHLIVLTMSLGCASLLAQVFESAARRQFELEEQLSREARCDSLTGLFNRRALSEILAQEAERSRRYQRPLSILLLDIDFFKRVNDRQGHDVGDEVLRHVAITCQKGLRLSDQLGRWGGEEFVVVLPETAPDEALALAERLRETVAKSECSTRGRQVRVTISVGVTSLETGESWESAYPRLDAALYDAKRAGRNRCVLRGPEGSSLTIQ
ncbi:MAG: GGDEF domain-containing protein [Candidatus Eremiobacteraeota bacterium]|nr:GGDEF domain-containing protein [Candidatus Eremiobacteraeota bacterium]